MADFEYNLLIIHNIEEVLEDLVQAFHGQVPDRPGALEPDVDFQAREFVGSLTISVSGGTEKIGGERTVIIHTARSAQDYRIFCKDHFHHAVLLNLSLPEDTFSKPQKETGMNLLKEIKTDHPETEIIVFTDHMVANRAIEAVNSGAFYFIQQPQINLDFVQALVARIIQMMEGAYLDTLTGLYNRRFFEGSLQNYFEEIKRIEGDNRRVQHGELSLIYIDLNDFKTVNDTYGHPEGDRVLRHISLLLKECFRKTDVIGRIGGDEFAVIVPGTHHGRALEVAERCRKEVEESSVSVKSGPGDGIVNPTISAGVATYPSPNHASDLDAFLKSADDALYYAKKEMKKNAVCGYMEDGTIFSFTSR